MILDIMKYVEKRPAKDAAKVSRKGKLRFAKRPFPAAIILITALMHIYIYIHIYIYTHTHTHTPNVVFFAATQPVSEESGGGHGRARPAIQAPQRSMKLAAMPSRSFFGATKVQRRSML